MKITLVTGVFTYTYARYPQLTLMPEIHSKEWLR